MELTRLGRYKVSFSIPIGESFVQFSVEDILDLGNAQLIERGLVDGGFESVHLSIRTDNKDQPFVAVYPSNLPENYLREKARSTIAGWGRSPKL